MEAAPLTPGNACFDDSPGLSGAIDKCQVASWFDRIPTVVEDGIDGLLLVEKENIGEHAATLVRRIGDPPLRHQPEEAARARIKREFSDRTHLEHYAKLVSKALARSRT